MRHLVKGRKLKRTSSHKKALMINLVTSLFQHKRLETTEAKAKELRPYAEKMISKAKHALANEKQGLLPNGNTVDVHNRRMVARFIKDKAVLQELFDAIAPVVESRNGGYARIIKTGFRRGDAAKTAIIELVDFANAQDGTVALKGKKKVSKKVTKPAAPKTESKPAPVVVEEVAAPVVAEEVIAPVEVVEEITPVVEEVVADATTEETPAEESSEENTEA